jgi:PhzF family phenazine biosynthesis protein
VTTAARYGRTVSTHAFTQVDVFSSRPFGGNPVAVVHLADDDTLSDEHMAAVARWTNLSETTFLLPPTDPGADYRLRIFTPGGELPFAGHPTLGSARAWLEAGGVAADPELLVQECGAGLVRVRRAQDTLAFAAPPLVRSGPPTDELRTRVLRALGLADTDVLAMSWVDNGPHWLGVLLPDAQTVLDLRPDFAAVAALGGTEVGVIGRHGPGGPADVEVRAFCPDLGIPEDPVTGSLNAGLAMWLTGEGLLPPAYVAAQGTALGRHGRVQVATDRGELWVGGAAQVRVSGTIDLSA